MILLMALQKGDSMTHREKQEAVRESIEKRSARRCQKPFSGGSDRNKCKHVRKTTKRKPLERTSKFRRGLIGR